MERILDLKTHTVLLPDLDNLGEYENTMGRILPIGFKFYYYIVSVPYSVAIDYICSQIHTQSVYGLRSVNGSGGIYEEDDVIDILYKFSKSEIRLCHNVLEENFGQGEWFFDQFWDDLKDFFAFVSPSTGNIYLASNYELLNKTDNNFSLVQIGLKDKLPFKLM